MCASDQAGRREPAPRVNDLSEWPDRRLRLGSVPALSGASFNAQKKLREQFCFDPGEGVRQICEKIVESLEADGQTEQARVDRQW
jgi:hypothetical protein